MTYMDPPTETAVRVRNVPIKVHCDFKIACTRRRVSMNTALIELMKLYAKTGGKCLDDTPAR